MQHLLTTGFRAAAGTRHVDATRLGHEGRGEAEARRGGQRVGTVAPALDLHTGAASGGVPDCVVTHGTDVKEGVWPGGPQRQRRAWHRLRHPLPPSHPIPSHPHPVGPEPTRRPPTACPQSSIQTPWQAVEPPRPPTPAPKQSNSTHRGTNLELLSAELVVRAGERRH